MPPPAWEGSRPQRLRTDHVSQSVQERMSHSRGSLHEFHQKSYRVNPSLIQRCVSHLASEGIALVDARITLRRTSSSPPLTFSGILVGTLFRSLQAWYSSSLTFSIQSTAFPSSASAMAMCVIAVVAVAPCQCFSPGSNQATSPGRICSIGPPSRCTHPHPLVTINV